MRVAFVLAGDELCEGHRRDANGAWMAQRVTTRGAVVASIEICRDDVEPLATAIRRAAETAALVVVSGGLGPTEDDRTREALALASVQPLEPNPGALEAIRDALARRGAQPAPTHQGQASVPAGGRWLENPEGVAPGVGIEVGGALVIALPGVPAELRAMFTLHVVPLLPESTEVAERSVFAGGIGEPKVEALLDGVVDPAQVRVGFYPHQGEVQVRLFARGPDAVAQAEAARLAVRAALGAAAYEPGPGERIEHVVVGLLKAQGLSLATAESLTGGLVAEMVTRVAGASAVFSRGWVAYSPEAKTAELGVSAQLIAGEGVVSAPVAAAMAVGARERARVPVALATTGVAGPGAMSTPDGAVVKPGRAYCALAWAGRETQTWRLDVPASRAVVRRRVAVSLLDRLRRALQA